MSSSSNPSGRWSDSADRPGSRTPSPGGSGSRPRGGHRWTAAIFGGDRRPALLALAVVGVGATLLTLARFVSLTWWAVAALGAEYAVFIFGRQAVDFRAPIVGGGLFVLTELMLWRPETGTLEDNQAHIRRLADVAIVAVASIGVGALVLLAGVAGRGSIIVTVLGFVGSVATLVLIALLATRVPIDSRNLPDGETRRGPRRA